MFQRVKTSEPLRAHLVFRYERKSNQVNRAGGASVAKNMDT